jgi:hypothetical protein
MIVEERLSENEDKRRLYGGDPHFRAGYISFANAVGAEEVGDVTWRLASVVLKPEALVGRKAVACCSYLFSVGFIPVAATTVHISSLAVRELWRYQINVATEERLCAMERIFAAGPSVFLAFRFPMQEGATGGASASSVLNQMKGPSDPAKRAAWQLRASIDAAPSRLLTYVHAAEEPGDVIRDVGVLFDEPQRRKLVRSMVQGEMGRDEMLGVVNDAMGAYALHDLEPVASMRRLRRALEYATGQGANAALTRASEWVEAAEAGSAGDWSAFMDAIAMSGIDVDAWDAITVGADVMAMDVGGERRLLS